MNDTQKVLIFLQQLQKGESSEVDTYIVDICIWLDEFHSICLLQGGGRQQQNLFHQWACMRHYIIKELIFYQKQNMTLAFHVNRASVKRVVYCTCTNILEWSWAHTTQYSKDLALIELQKKCYIWRYFWKWASLAIFFFHRELYKKNFWPHSHLVQVGRTSFFFIGVESQVIVSFIQPPECFSAENGKALQSSLQSSDLLVFWLLTPLPTMLA